ncbi:hypothetical protein H310_09769 [Aphanomyces invadans]|uniref:Amino acid permease/ SLC12A domain-containing protein n=1 Tax=Aphanomyces invadans TaxID=157072 RepID=A0A024TV10_9STRA|nr:hypothetical protein H310_09769 [Aphanomyces invadans]ETV97441.1 hypothetical protein H310_09769 [Aphanomyces invadans]|eukprot:XP_008874149.1 hypothetical protein H310_09769 [Aphanomyces invadans]
MAKDKAAIAPTKGPPAILKEATTLSPLSPIAPDTPAGPGPATVPATTSNGCHIVDVKEIVVDPSDQATAIHVWALGVVSVIGGQFYGWNESFKVGFLPYFISQLFMGVAYVIYVSCIAEVGGKVPGGSYGLARAVLGFYPGYLLSCLEFLEYTSYASVSVVYVTDFVTTHLKMNSEYQPLVWLLFYAICIGFLDSRGKYMWRCMLVLLVASLLPGVLFIFGSLPYVNFKKNAILHNFDNGETTWATGTISTAFFAILPSTTVGFAGVESPTVNTGFVKDPAVNIPKGTRAAVWTLLASNIAMVLVLASLPPGLEIIATDEFCLNRGLYLGMGFTSRTAEWILIPAQIGTAIGFSIPIARLTQAMADSNLLPQWLGLRGQTTTRRSLVVASIFGYCLCLVSFYSPMFKMTLQNISIVAGTLCYAGQTLGFVMLRTSYKIDTKGYKSPYGLTGAYYVFVVFFLVFVSIAGGFQGDDGIAILSTIGFVAVLTVYYLLVCQKVQTVSKEEYASIFKFSVMKFNKLRASKKKRTSATSQLSRASLVMTAKQIIPKKSKVGTELQMST